MWSSAPSRRPRPLVVALLAAGVVLVLLVVAVVVLRPGSGSGTAAPPAYRVGRVVVADTFERQVDPGWGEADEGGRYAVTGETDLRVEDGVGVVTLPRPGSSRSASLTQARPQDLTASVDVLAPSPVKYGSGVYVALHLRANGGFYYRALLRFAADRQVFLSLARFDGSDERRLELAPETTVAKGVRPGQRLAVAVTVTGSAPVELTVVVQRGSGGPVTVRGTDTAAARLVGGGGLTLWTYVGGKSEANKQIGFDNLNVRSLLSDALDDGTGSLGLEAPGAPPPPAGDDDGAAPEDAAREQDVAGSRPLGSTRHPVPLGAFFVAPDGSDRATGTREDPWRSIQHAVDQVRGEGTVVVRGGTYHESVGLPAGKRITLQAAPGEVVWLDGSSAVTGWQRSGRTWQVGWEHFFDSSPTYTRGEPDGTTAGWRFVDPAHPMAAHPDQVWVDGEAQAQVGSADEVVDGTFFVDRRSRALVLGTDPTRRSVRASTLATGLAVVGAGDVVRGIGIRRYATSVWQMGAATVYGADVLLEDLVVVDNATTGLTVGSTGVELNRLTAERNGLMGLHAAQADGLRVRSVAVARNNLEHFNRAPSAGGMKIGTSDAVEVRDSSFTENDGHGLWFDESSTEVAVTGSRVERNTGAGLVLELSSRVQVVNNVLADNGVHGLWVIDTDRVTVAHNSFARNEGSNLLAVTDGRGRRAGRSAGDDRAAELPWVSRDLAVWNNVLADAVGDCVVCVVDYTGRLRPERLGLDFDHNLYQRTGAHVPFARWPEPGRSPSVIAEFAAFRRQTGQDAESRLLTAGERVLDRTGRVTATAEQATRDVARSLPAEVASSAGAPEGSLPAGAWLR